MWVKERAMYPLFYCRIGWLVLAIYVLPTKIVIKHTDPFNWFCNNGIGYLLVSRIALGYHQNQLLKGPNNYFYFLLWILKCDWMVILKRNTVINLHFLNVIIQLIGIKMSKQKQQSSIVMITPHKVNENQL